VLIEMVEQRKSEGGLPIFLASAEDADAGVRTAALDAVGAIGDDKQLPQLLTLLTKAKDAGDRRVIERAVASISGRWGAASAPHLVPLVKGGGNATADTRIVALHALAAAGGGDALAAVRAAAEDADPAVQDEAVRTLSTWPNRWPEDANVAEPLLTLAKSAAKPAHRVLGVRGYLQYVQGDKKLAPDQRLARVDAILPQVTRPQEKTLVVATLGAIGSAGAVERLTKLAAEAGVTEEACAAIVKIVGRGNSGIPDPVRRAALQKVAETSKSPAVKNRANEILKDIPKE
jgi:HEAT repeat protein